MGKGGGDHCYPDVLWVCCEPLQSISTHMAVHLVCDLARSWSLHVALFIYIFKWIEAK